MEKQTFYFLTSYSKSMLETYSITIDGKSQSDYYGIDRGDSLIYINQVKLSQITAAQENIIIEIIFNEDKRTNTYKIKINKEKLEKKKCIFLFNYKLESVKNEMLLINWKSLFFWTNYNKYIIDKSFTNNEIFIFFRKYFLDKGKSMEESELVQTFLDEIGKNESIPFDIGISILIIYNDTNCLGKFLSIAK